MSTQPDAVVRNWFDEVWNQGREDTIDRLFAADCVAHGTPGGDQGRDEFRQFWKAFRGAFPDIHITVDRTIGQGEFVAAYCHVTGTHTGASLGLAPTGKRVDFYGVTIGRVSDGQFHEGWNCYDMLTAYQQLGVVPQIQGP